MKLIVKKVAEGIFDFCESSDGILYDGMIYGGTEVNLSYANDALKVAVKTGEVGVYDLTDLNYDDGTEIIGFASMNEFIIALKDAGFTGNFNVPQVGGDFIPLSGTTIGNPISGDLQFIAGKGITCTNSNEDALNKLMLGDSDVGINLFLDTDTIISYSLGQQGISSNTEFTPSTPSDYVQKGYLETQIPIAPSTGTYILKSIDGVHQWVEEV